MFYYVLFHSITFHPSFYSLSIKSLNDVSTLSSILASKITVLSVKALPQAAHLSLQRLLRVPSNSPESQTTLFGLQAVLIDPRN
jgi:hypothetical protein